MSVANAIRAFIRLHNIQQFVVDHMLHTGHTGVAACNALSRCGFRIQRGTENVNELIAPHTALLLLNDRPPPLEIYSTPVVLFGAAASAAVADESPAAANRILRLPDATRLSDFASMALEHRDSLDESVYGFGPIALTAGQLFFASRRTLSVTNIRPVLPGHCLVLPRRRTARMDDLSAEEYAELWSAVRVVSAALEHQHGATGVTIVVQDGRAAGQTVPHVHVHVIPRVVGDLLDNDTIYPAINESSKASAAAAAAAVSSGAGAGAGAWADDAHQLRTMQQMEQEAAEYRCNPELREAQRQHWAAPEGSASIPFNAATASAQQDGDNNTGSHSSFVGRGWDDPLRVACTHIETAAV